MEHSSSPPITPDLQNDSEPTRAIVPVVLERYGDENLVARSQARGLLERFGGFREVVLDFKDVESIGPAFADEIFRVFANQHPEICITWVNAKEQVEKMIRRAQNHSEIAK